MRHLDNASQLIDYARSIAQLHGDGDGARRLAEIHTSITREREYFANVELGYGRVRRLRRGPHGAALGWYFHCDDVTRTRRRDAGLSAPNVSEGAVSGAASSSPKQPSHPDDREH